MWSVGLLAGLASLTHAWRLSSVLPPLSGTRLLPRQSSPPSQASCRTVSLYTLITLGTVGSYTRAAVLSWEQFSPPEDDWQCLETLFVVTTRAESWILVSSG